MGDLKPHEGSDTLEGESWSKVGATILGKHEKHPSHIFYDLIPRYAK